MILETVISNKASMTISGQEYSMNLVKSKFLKLNSSHIEYVLGCLGKNTTKVYNIKSYLLASLFNAVSTMNSYYKAAPTREQKKIMRAHGLVPENWLVVKNLPDTLEVVSRTALKKIGRKPRTKTISKSL